MRSNHALRANPAITLWLQWIRSRPSTSLHRIWCDRELSYPKNEPVRN